MTWVKKRASLTIVIYDFSTSGYIVIKIIRPAIGLLSFRESCWWCENWGGKSSSYQWRSKINSSYLLHRSILTSYRSCLDMLHWSLGRSFTLWIPRNALNNLIRIISFIMWHTYRLMNAFIQCIFFFFYKEISCFKALQSVLWMLLKHSDLFCSTDILGKEIRRPLCGISSAENVLPWLAQRVTLPCQFLCI